jgi:hypothetical protein
MFESELEMVLAKRELVMYVTTEKSLLGRVDTPGMGSDCRDGRERMKIYGEQ